MESPAICSAFPPASHGGSQKEREGSLPQVDPFLVEALENPRHRLTVLRMELDIQRFMQISDQHQFEFQRFPTSYLRRVAHRVAQHYGLQTIALDSIVDGLGSRIIARKTPDSRFPAVCLSEVPAKQSDNGVTEHVKIAIRTRPSRTSQSDATELGIKNSHVRTVEERKEEYDKARARIFSNSSTTDVESLCSSGDEQGCYSTIDENEQTSSKDGPSRVAIFRDREKDRSDPDYDRSYDRYVRGLTPSQNLGLGACNILQPPPLPQYEAGFPQFGQLLGSQSWVIYRPSNPAMNSICAFGSNQTSPNDPVNRRMQWPSPAMMYAHSYEHFRHHAIFQAPFYQHPLSFEHSRNC